MKSKSWDEFDAAAEAEGKAVVKAFVSCGMLRRQHPNRHTIKGAKVARRGTGGGEAPKSLGMILQANR